MAYHSGRAPCGGHRYEGRSAVRPPRAKPVPVGLPHNGRRCFTRSEDCSVRTAHSARMLATFTPIPDRGRRHRQPKCWWSRYGVREVLTDYAPTACNRQPGVRTARPARPAPRSGRPGPSGRPRGPGRRRYAAARAGHDRTAPERPGARGRARRTRARPATGRGEHRSGSAERPAGRPDRGGRPSRTPTWPAGSTSSAWSTAWTCGTTRPRSPAGSAASSRAGPPRR